MVDAVATVTVDVSTVNEAVVDPDDTVALAGTLAISRLLLSSTTTAPPDGAAAVSVTVP